MIDLTQIDEATRLARGDYSTVRAAHEDAKKTMQMLCGQLGAFSAQILRRVQPDNDGAPESCAELLTGARNTLTLMEACVAEIEQLAQQRAALKPLAWGKKP